MPDIKTRYSKFLNLRVHIYLDLFLDSIPGIWIFIELLSSRNEIYKFMFLIYVCSRIHISSFT